MLTIDRGNFRFAKNPDFSRLHLGYPPSGPADRYALKMANLLVGNNDSCCGLEFILSPIGITFERECTVAVTGAPCRITVNGSLRRTGSRFQVSAGTHLKLNFQSTGCRSYLAVGGGLYRNESQASNRFIFREETLTLPKTRPIGRPPWLPPTGYVRVTLGPECMESDERQLAKPWTVQADSNHMGVRLSGNRLNRQSFNILSSCVQDGTIQATPKGLIALLRDRGTLGGYPRIATVIDCDVDTLAQYRPGQILRFQVIQQTDAIKCCRLYDEAMLRLDS